MKNKLQRENVYAATLVLLMGIGAGAFFAGLRHYNSNNEQIVEPKETVEYIEPYKRKYNPVSEEKLQEELFLYGNLKQ